jgi:hypothetical protein
VEKRRGAAPVLTRLPKSDPERIGVKEPGSLSLTFYEDWQGVSIVLKKLLIKTTKSKKVILFSLSLLLVASLAFFLYGVVFAENPPIEVTGMDPNTGQQGTTVHVTIYGSGFSEGCTAVLQSYYTYISGTNYSYTGIPGSFTCDFEIPPYAEVTSDYRLMVYKTGEGYNSLWSAFSVTEKTPTVTVNSIDPNTGNCDNVVDVTISGADFQSGAEATLHIKYPYGGSSQNCKGYDYSYTETPNSFTCSFNIPLWGPTGTYDLYVQNPDSNYGFLSSCFSVGVLGPPVIDDATSEGCLGTQMGVWGNGFWSVKDSGNLIVTNVAEPGGNEYVQTVSPSSWHNTSISFYLTGDLTPGTWYFVVETINGRSNYYPFTVTSSPTPHIDYGPEQGIVGCNGQVGGTDFGNVQQANDHVWLTNGEDTYDQTIVGWHNCYIDFTISGTPSPGQWYLYVETAGGESNQWPITVFNPSGTVTDLDNNPIPNINLYAYDLDDPQYDSETQEILGENLLKRNSYTYTNDNGMFVFTDLVEGHRYKILAKYTESEDPYYAPLWYQQGSNGAKSSGDATEVIASPSVSGINIKTTASTDCVSGTVTPSADMIMVFVGILDKDMPLLLSQIILPPDCDYPEGSFERYSRLCGDGQYKVFFAGLNSSYGVEGKAYYEMVETHGSGTAVLGNAIGIDHDFNSSSPTEPTVSNITPTVGNLIGTVDITNLAGTDFVDGATVQLTKGGQDPINATSVNVVSDTQITCTFNLTSKAIGSWNVVVTNPDEQSGTLTDGFTIGFRPSQLASKFQNNGLFILPEGNSITETPSITTVSESIIANPSGQKVTVPATTEITQTNAQNMDTDDFVLEDVDPATYSGLPANINLKGGLKWGIPDIELTFNKPVTLKIYVGTEYNGQSFAVLRSTTGTGNWTSDGITGSPDTVSNGFVTFNATKASDYGAGEMTAEDDGNQIIEGDVAGEIILTENNDMTGLVWSIGNANEDESTTAINVKSNVDFDVKAESDRNVLEEWNGSSYTGLKALQTALQMKIKASSGETGGSSSFADVVNGSITNFLSDEQEADNDGRNYDTWTKQYVNYGDPVAEGSNVYRCIITWTASENI